MNILSNEMGSAVIYDDNGIPEYFTSSGNDFEKCSPNFHIPMFFQGGGTSWKNVGGIKFEEIENEEFPFHNLKNEMKIRYNVSTLFILIQMLLADNAWEGRDEEYRIIIEKSITDEETLKRLKDVMKFIKTDEIHYKYEWFQEKTPNLNDVLQTLKKEF